MIKTLKGLSEADDKKIRNKLFEFLLSAFEPQQR